MGSIIVWMIAHGIPANLAKPLLIALSVLIGIGAIVGGVALWLRFHDRHVISAAQDHAEAKEAPVIRKADDNAATQRLQDQVTVQKRQEDIHHAIDPLPDQGLTARQRARACVILRRQASERGTKAPANC